jgi:hypothetical protein
MTFAFFGLGPRQALLLVLVGVLLLLAVAAALLVSRRGGDDADEGYERFEERWRQGVEDSGRQGEGPHGP